MSKYYCLINKTKNTVVAEKVCIADTFFRRLKGFMFKKNIDFQEGLFFTNVNAIHMFFMRFSIDVIFLTNDLRVLKITHTLKPWRLTACLRAWAVIELPAEKSLKTSTEIGDVLELIPGCSPSVV